MEQVTFLEMLNKLESGEWERVTTKYWQENDGQFLTMKKKDGRTILLLNESLDSVVGWGIGMSDSLSMRGFMELKL